MSPTPTLDIAAYQAKVYEKPRCWKLVADVYSNLLAVNPAHVETLTEDMRRAARTFRLELFKRRGGMHQLAEPRDLAVVLMWPSDRRKLPHCGIWWQGKVLHVNEAGAVLHQDVASLGDLYQSMEYWGL